MKLHAPIPARLSQPPDDGFRLAMAASGIGMAIVGLDGRWQEVNPALERLLGQPRGALSGQPLSRCVQPDAAAAQVARELAELASGRTPRLEACWHCRRADGSEVMVQADVALVRSAAGAPGYLLAQLREQGAEHAALAALRADIAQREAALATAHRQQQQFADTVAHDLRAPLRAIESFAVLLDERSGAALDATGRDHLQRIRAAAARMGGLLAALGELSHASRVPLRPALVDVSLLADWVAAELRDAEPARVAEIRVQPGLRGYGDEHLLKLLLGQLLGNAWKFSRADAPVCIAVDGVSGADGSLQLQVRDCGCGFDMRYVHKVFEPFQRLHGPDEGGGHGLGLAIAQQIVARHHGQLRAESVPGAGSTFHVTLPAAPAAITGNAARIDAAATVHPDHP